MTDEKKKNGKQQVVDVIPDEIHLQDGDRAIVELMATDMTSAEVRISEIKVEVEELRETLGNLKIEKQQRIGAFLQLKETAKRFMASFPEKYSIPGLDSGYTWNVDGERQVIVITKLEERAAD